MCLAADSSAGRCSVNQGEFQLLAIAVHQGTGRQERIVEHCISTPFRVRPHRGALHLHSLQSEASLYQTDTIKCTYCV